MLLEIFYCHRQAAVKYGRWKWHRLAQVCQRWRSVVFSYPRHLNLRIVSTYNKPLQNAPNFWPVLPVIIWYPYFLSGFHPILKSSDEDNISDILKNPARVCEIDLDILLAQPLLGRLASSLEGSFPALEHLRLQSLPSDLPNEFLGGSAPRLCVLHLKDTAVPALPRILSSSKNLISLRVEDAREEYFTAEDLAIGLSTATRLKSLVLGFDPVTTPPLSPRGPSPSSSPITLTSLTEFQYEGAGWYLRAFLSKINVPMIEKISVSCYCVHGHDIAELCELFGHWHGEALTSSRCFTTRIRLSRYHIECSHHFARIPLTGVFRVHLPYQIYHPVLPLVAQVCFRLESQNALPNVTHLEIEDYPYFVLWNHTEQDPGTYWLDLLRALTGLKTLHVSGTVGSRLASALAQITGEPIREIMPTLQELHFGPETPLSTPTSTVIGPFVTERQLYGLPVSVHFKKLNRVEGSWGE